MSGILDGKTIVVSGVGQGLGREVVAAALRDGANVVLGARTEANLRTIANELDPAGTRTGWLVTDITSPDQATALVALAVARFDRLDGVVNCAALDAIFGGIEGADFARWHEAFEINLFGSMNVTSAAVAAMKDHGGSIVFIGSQSIYWSQLPQAAYAASKAALLGAIAHLVHEVGPYRIRLNTVIPSWMWGPPVQAYVSMTAASQGATEDEVLAGLTRQTALGAMAADEDVAEAVLFFLSDRSRMITGQSLLVNAGEYLR